MNKLSLRATLVISMLLCGILPVVATSVLTASNSTKSLHEAGLEKLDATRSGRQQHLESYLQLVRDHNALVARDLSTGEAMIAFTQAFESIPADIDASESELRRSKDRLQSYYTSNFATEYKNRTGNSVDARSLLPVNDIAKIAQSLYISESSYPLGEKEKLNRSEGDTEYDDVHERFHPIFRDILQRFDYYDIFLVEPENGQIVYSVFKELDYGTSLLNGPYRNTNFAELVRSSFGNGPGETVISDFDFYAPSYDAAAAFISTPIFVDGELAGSVVFQMPVDRINEIMLDEAGLGDTGDAQIVGADGLYRNQARFGGDGSLLNAKLNHSVVQRAVSGEAGSEIIEMDGQEFLVSFSPLEIQDVDWAIVARITTEEALASLDRLNLLMLISLGVASAFVLIFSVYLGNRIHKSLGGDPQEILTLAQRTGAGDLSPSPGDDKRVGAFAALLNMRTELRTVLSGVNGIAQEVQVGSRELSDGNLGLSERTEQQAANLEETASSTEELTSTVRQNAENARSANELASSTQERAQSSGEISEKAVSAMQDISVASEKIADIIGVIDEIAFQTNLLALNAAVEAARAGEQGRGFAVVASEVRELAGRSASAAKEIKELIEDSVDKVRNGTTLVQESGEELDMIVESVGKLAELVSEISQASEEQSVGIDQINQALIHMDGVTQQNAALVEQAAATSKTMSDQATQLNSQISIFCVEDAIFQEPNVSAEPISKAPRKSAINSAPPRQPAKANVPPSPPPAETAAAPVQRASSSEELWEEF